MYKIRNHAVASRKKIKAKSRYSRKLYGGSIGHISKRTINEQLFGTDRPYDNNTSITNAEIYFRKVNQVIRNFNYMSKNRQEYPSQPDDIELTAEDEYQITNTTESSNDAQWQYSIKALEDTISSNEGILYKLLYIKEYVLPMRDILYMNRSQITPEMNKIYATVRDFVKKPHILTIKSEKHLPEQFITIELINFISVWSRSIDTISSIDKYREHYTRRFDELFQPFYNLCQQPTFPIPESPLHTIAITIAKYIEAQDVIDNLIQLIKDFVIKFHNTQYPPDVIHVLYMNTVKLIKILPDLFMNARLGILKFDSPPPALSGKQMVSKPRSPSLSRSSSSSSSSSKSGSAPNKTMRSLCQSLELKDYPPVVQKRIVDLCKEIDDIKQKLVPLGKSKNDNDRRKMFRTAIKQKLQIIRNLLTIGK
jgi:hypothetical protein